MVKVLFCRLEKSGRKELPLPSYETELAAGMDVCAEIEGEATLAPGERLLVGTGLAAAVPAGFEMQVRPRSGLAVRHGITVLNTPGTIDADYRGEIRILLVNLGSAPYTVRRGDRIAQLVVAPVVRAEIATADDLDETERGSGGFGHTGN